MVSTSGVLGIHLAALGIDLRRDLIKKGNLLPVLLVLFTAVRAFGTEVEVDSTIKRRGIGAQVWESKGWVLIQEYGTPIMEAIDPEGNSTWLDISPLVEGTPVVDTAARVGDGFLVAGILGRVEDEMSLGFLILDSEGEITEQHDLGRIGQDGLRLQSIEAISVKSAFDVGDGTVALFWSGFRGQRETRQHGVSLFDADTWQMTGDVYGPVDLPRHGSGAERFRRQLCQVRMTEDTLVVVDVDTPRLVLIPTADPKAVVEIDLTDDGGEKAPVVGWWISRSGKEVHIVYLVMGDEDVVTRLVAYGLDGEDMNRRPFNLAARVILPTDTNHVLVVRDGSKVERVWID